MESNPTTDKLSNIKLTCKIHNSEIGGVCNDFSCKNKTQLLCIKCVADNQSCIRQHKHSLIPASEFVNNFFNTEYENLKKDFNFSKNVSNIENYLQNSDQILKD